MQIDTISYERRVSDGSYGNRMLHVSATVEEEENPDAVALRLRIFVANQLAADVKAEEEERDAAYKRRQEEYERKRQERLNAVASSIPEDDAIPFDGEEEDDDA